jgi:RNA polymerase sigma-70 factor (sigma-E family)
MQRMGLFGRARRAGRDAEFEAFYTARGAGLRATAYLLCGNWHQAEDLTQAAFTKIYLAWNRLDERETLDQYARTVLLRTFLDERRRPWRREHATEPGSEVFDDVAYDPGPADQMLLRDALAAVPKGQRAVLVLRFWADLSVDQTAEVLGCSTGSVKSQSARGLAKLREVMAGLEIGPDGQKGGPGR